MTGADDAPVTCATCATTVERCPPTWTRQVGPQGPSWLCEACTRQDLRSIEARLDEAWW